VRMGKTTAEEAASLHIAYKTAETHRWRIRKKLGLTGKRTGLANALADLGDPAGKLGELAGKNQG